MIRIRDIHAVEILDSRGYPTLEVTVQTNRCSATVSVPSGKSTGIYEARELRDGGKRYQGFGVKKAIKNVHHLATLLKGMDCTRQVMIDEFMIKIDGTPQKKKLGANVLFGISLACARAAAASTNKPLYIYLNHLFPLRRKIRIPQLFCNILNGGKHANNGLAFQEFMIIPHLGSVQGNIQAASEIDHTLQKILTQRYSLGSTNVGDEGGFAPQLRTTTEALDLLMNAIIRAGYKNKVDLAIDCAASEFFAKGYYTFEGKKWNSLQILAYYKKLISHYPLISIEDPFEQNDFSSFAALHKQTKIQIVGDDLTVTNPNRVLQAIDAHSCNCLLLKINQIGTLTEAFAAAAIAFENGWQVMVSHRSGETNDAFIADLAVALGCGQIKAGAPCRGERVAKYNRLLEIERELSQKKRN